MWSPHSSPLCELNSLFLLLYTVYHSYLSECQDRKNTLSIKTIVKYGWNWGENSSKEISTLSEPVFVSYEITVSNDSNLEPQKKFWWAFWWAFAWARKMTDRAPKTKFLANSNDWGGKRSKTVNSLATNSFF